MSPDEVQSVNFKAFERWISKYKNKMRPDKKKIKVFYTGQTINMGPVGAKAKKIEESFNPDGAAKLGEHVSNLWAMVEEMTRQPPGKHTAGFASIDTMLKRWTKNIPVLLEPESGDVASGIKNMQDYARAASNLRSRDPAFFKKMHQGKVFESFSRIYSKNCQGEIMILDAGLQRVADISKTNNLIHVELKKLIKNKDISDRSKAEVVNFMEKKLAAYGKQAKALKKEIEQAKKELMKPMKK